MRSVLARTQASCHVPVLLCLALAALPAGAKVVAQGKPSKGYYWQKVEQSNGSVQFMCRATATPGKLQTAQSCEAAKARKP